MQQIAIVGAGMAGLVAANRLKRAGFQITLFEKSRGLGGRLATRRVGHLQFDHGAQYFTTKGASFRASVGHWRSAGQVTEWFDGAFVGLPGMSAVGRAMAQNHAIVSGCQVTEIRKGRGGWEVHGANGFVNTPGNGRFSASILALPAPQANPIALSAGVVLPELTRARYSPCWALLLAFSKPLPMQGDWLRPEDEAIAWIARNSSKPGRMPGSETVVVHATPAWSRLHLEMPPDAVASDLLARLRSLLEFDLTPHFSSAHRWRYALVEETAGTAFLWDPAARLGACGDWCLGPRVEAAFDSGEAMAKAILREVSCVV